MNTLYGLYNTYLLQAQEDDQLAIGLVGSMMGI